MASKPTTDKPCPYGHCDGSGFVVNPESQRAEPCRCRPQRLARNRARRLNSVIPRHFRDAGFDRWPVTQIDQRVVAEVRRFALEIDDRLETGAGLWLMGDVGTGKTTLAMLVSKAALDAGRSVAIYSLPRLLAEIRNTFDEDSRTSYTGLIDRLSSVELLHIDDVGAENTSPWVLEQLYALINSRYEDERSLIITTNLDDDALEAQIGQRTVSRIRQLCGEPIPLHGDDLRDPASAAAHRHSSQSGRAVEEPFEQPSWGTPSIVGYGDAAFRTSPRDELP